MRLLLGDVLEEMLDCKADTLNVNTMNSFDFSEVAENYDFQVIALPMFNVLPRQFFCQRPK